MTEKCLILVGGNYEVDNIIRVMQVVTALRLDPVILNED